MPAYPSTLPSPMGSFSGDAETTLRTFVSQSKRVRRFGHGNKILFNGTFSWTFLPSEYASFVTWWATTLLSGTLTFTLDMTTGGSVQNHVCQFISIPRMTRDCDVYKVSAKVKILTRPSGVSSTWFATFRGPPATFPYTEVGFPQMAYAAEAAQSFLATSGVPNVATTSAAVGTNYTFKWVLTGTAFDYLIEWYIKALRFGQAKFVASFGELGTQLYTVADELSFDLSGLNFEATMRVQGIAYDTSTALDYVFNRAEDYSTVDRWINRAEDVAPDRKINRGQP